MATLPPQLKKLKSYKTSTAKEILRELKAAQKQIKAQILLAAKEAKTAKSAKEREKLFAFIDAKYKTVANGIDAHIKNLTAKVAKVEHEAAVDTLPNPKITRYDPERTERYFRIIHPMNGRNLAAVFTDQMTQKAINGLRNAFVDVFREATVSGMTANETQKALRDRWDEVAGDTNLYRFVDKSGRSWENARYLQMLVQTNAQRVATESRIDTYAANGVSLARIPDDGDDECPICAAWKGRIIQLVGKSSKFPTYDDALAAGMFHPNCVHYPEPLDEYFDRDEIALQKKIGKPDDGGMADISVMQKQKDQIDELRYVGHGMSAQDARRAVTADRLESAIRKGTFSDEAAEAAGKLTAEQLDIIRATGIPKFDIAKKGDIVGQTYRGRILAPRDPSIDDILNLLHITPPAKASDEPPKSEKPTKTEKTSIEPEKPPTAPEKPPTEPDKAGKGRPLPFPDNPANLRVLRALGGSTGAELVVDSHGQKFVRKMGGQAGGAAADHVRSEAAADEIYRALGCNVPAVKLYESSGQPPIKLSRYIEDTVSLGEYLEKASQKDRERVLAEIKKDFDIDVLMGNRDVVGASRDNILVDERGTPWRIDNGAAFGWRAQGARKSDWSKWPDELYSMQTSRINSGIFDNVSVVDTVIRSTERDFGQLFEAVPQQDRAIFRERVKELQELGHRAASFKQTGYVEDYNAAIVEHSYALAKEGFREAVPQAVDVERGEYGFFRTQKRPATSKNKLLEDSPQEYKSLTDFAFKYITKTGGDPSIVRDWQRSQADNSWNPESCVRKIIQEEARPMPKDTLIDRGVRLEKKQMAHKIIDRYTKETARKTFSAYDAIVQLALENCKIAHCDRETRTAALIRTESSSNDVRYDISGSDGLIQFPRGACESHSLFKSTVVGGSVGTLVDVPFPLIKGMYLFESLPGSGGGCFYSDKENEITCDARGCDTIYTGQMNNGATLPQKMYNKLKELKKAEEK